jgi:hypothetical protein
MNGTGKTVIVFFLPSCGGVVEQEDCGGERIFETRYVRLFTCVSRFAMRISVSVLSVRDQVLVSILFLCLSIPGTGLANMVLNSVISVSVHIQKFVCIFLDGYMPIQNIKHPYPINQLLTHAFNTTIVAKYLHYDNTYTEYNHLVQQSNTMNNIPNIYKAINDIIIVKIK